VNVPCIYSNNVDEYHTCERKYRCDSSLNHRLGSTIYCASFIYFCFFFSLDTSMHREHSRQEIHRRR
jgi:hypothetical protein